MASRFCRACALVCCLVVWSCTNDQAALTTENPDEYLAARSYLSTILRELESKIYTIPRYSGYVMLDDNLPIGYTSPGIADVHVMKPSGSATTELTVTFGITKESSTDEPSGFYGQVPVMNIRVLPVASEALANAMLNELNEPFRSVHVWLGENHYQRSIFVGMVNSVMYSFYTDSHLVQIIINGFPSQLKDLSLREQVNAAIMYILQTMTWTG